MLLISQPTARAIGPHATSQAWVMFVQVNPPVGGAGPILIEGTPGAKISERLNEIARNNAFDTMIIGLIEVAGSPEEHARAIAARFAASHMHDGWHQATADLIAFIQHTAQGAIQDLLARTHPGALSGPTVDIEAIAKILGVSVPTVRRMVAAGSIPFFRWGRGRALRFVPADVIATAQRTR